MKRTTPLKRVPFKRKPDAARLRRQRALHKLGKQGHKNRRANAQLAKDFIASGLPQYCEARLEGCRGQEMLSWAHSKKRRYLTTEELTRAALLCTPCHARAERLSHAEMEKFVEGIIERRAA